jgi:hypothetical protein
MELAYNGDGVLDAYGDPNTLRMPAYYCADDPLYVQLGCTVRPLKLLDLDLLAVHRVGMPMDVALSWSVRHK